MNVAALPRVTRACGSLGLKRQFKFHRSERAAPKVLLQGALGRVWSTGVRARWSPTSAHLADAEGPSCVFTKGVMVPSEMLGACWAQPGAPSS